MIVFLIIFQLFYFFANSQVFSNLHNSKHDYYCIQESDQLESSLLGGKALGLTHLAKIPNINVPHWFCITTSTYQNFIEQNNIDKEIRNLDALSSKWISSSGKQKEVLENRIYASAKQIRSSILLGILPVEFHEELHQCYKTLIEKCGHIPPVAVRSSGTIEDLPESSFAGIYDTFLNQQNEENIVSSILRCWASVFNDRAIFERISKNINHTMALTGVIVQQMVDAKAAGTAFTLEIGTGYEGIEIAANYGLGESVVEGEITVDKWLVHPKTGHVLKSTLGNKKSMVFSDSYQSGTKEALNTEEAKKQYCLDPLTVKNIASQVKEIGDYFRKHFSYSYIDTEFAIDKMGKVFFLQARPLILVTQNGFQALDKEEVKSHELIAKGRYSVPGITQGKIKFIPSWQDLAEGKIHIESEDIVLTYVSTNYWSQYMTNFKGMITQEGGPTSHPILLCRERKVPCVIGISEENFESLREYDGHHVTIDGINQKIYAGKVKVTDVSPTEFASQFQIIQEEEILPRDQLINDLQKYNILLIEEVNGGGK